MFCNTKINCIGYAFRVCHRQLLLDNKNPISIARTNNEEITMLNELKEIVACYESELPYICGEESLVWPISNVLINKVKSAKSLSDITNQTSEGE